MTNPSQPEPSMEEILASIRRIISDEPGAVNTAQVEGEAPAAAPEPELPPEDDIIELTPDMRTDIPEPTPEPVVAEIEPAPAPEPMPEPEPVYQPEPTPEPVAYTEPEPIAPLPEEAPLMSEQTEAAAAAALAGLASGLTSRSGFEGRTVEDIVRELLRPMLRQWMDANLPTLVERLVEAEIERLARRGR